MKTTLRPFYSITCLIACGTFLFGCEGTTPPECVQDETLQTEETCGLNGEGFVILTCLDGTFSSEDGCTGTDVCVNDEVREGSTVCGFNDEGLLSQTCTSGQWEDGEECSGDDVCLNGETQESGTSCGLNDEGLFIEDCVEGAWVEGTECTGTHECVNEDSQEGSTVCGLNDEGVLMQFCIEGAWVDDVTCTGTDECTNDETQEGTTACGLNNEGVFMQDCTEGAWVENETCTGTDVCVNGELQDTETLCGLNSEGILTQDCTEGAWVDGACTGTDVCVNEETQEGTTACGLNEEGVFMQDCTEGAWVDNETCTGTHICVNESTQESETTCGLNSEGVLLDDCIDGAWVAGTTCTGTDVCVNDETQEGPTVCGYENDGFLMQECVAGVWTDKEDNAGCNDDTTWVDSYGDGCLWYNDHPNDCDVAHQWVNSDGLDAQDACCICDGGINETTSVCSAETDCINGASQQGDSPCGLNGEGGLMQDCVQGVWVDNDTCEDANDVCVNGTKEDTEIACGTNLEGFGQNLCASGQWLPYLSGGDACVDDGNFFDSWLQSCWNYNWGGCDTALDKVNDEGVDATMACCVCGGGTSVCTGTDECTNGETKEDVEGDTCGLNNEGFFQLECIDGLWEDTTICSGTHECVNGTSQPSIEESCEAGAPQRVDCVYGQWQPQNQSYPAQCSDDDTFLDANNANCAMYALTPDLCDDAEDLANGEGLDATEACCECGGGATTPPYSGPACFEPYRLKGVMDFGLPSTDGKALHFVVHEDITDLSIYGVGVANNGGGTDGQEYTFPAISVTAGQQILLARNVTALENYFGTCFVIFDHTLDANISISQNGNDAIELFKNGEVIQTYGNPDGFMPNYEDSWAFQFWGSNYNTASANCTDGITSIFDAPCLYPACEPYVPEEAPFPPE